MFDVFALCFVALPRKGSPPIHTPPVRCCILQYISKPAACILNCTLTTETAFQNRLFVFFISFLHLKSEKNYGTRSHLFTFQNPNTFCIPITPLCIHKLGFNIPNSIVKLKNRFFSIKKVTWNYNFILQIQNQILHFDVEIAFLHSETVFPYSKFKNTYYLKTAFFVIRNRKLNYGIDITPYVSKFEKDTRLNVSIHLKIMLSVYEPNMTIDVISTSEIKRRNYIK